MRDKFLENGFFFFSDLALGIGVLLGITLPVVGLRLTLKQKLDFYYQLKNQQQHSN
ncbi:hypothetical protein BY996DRAFT_4622232 [Phakopsora pachyrhizi]|nr:hypothetical protein BY996DRAFT_4622232 [Phakopsora pachyrhizi]